MRVMPFTHRLRSAFNQRRWPLLVAWLVGGAVYAVPSFHEYATLGKAMDQVFPNTQVQSHALVLDATQITAIESSLHQRVPTDHVTIYTFSRDQQVVGYGMVLDELGKHYPITFFVGVDIQQRVKGVVLMVYREDYGQSVRKRRFMRQFRGKTSSDPIQVNHDITSVSGATISSYSIATGVRRVLAVVGASLSSL